MEVKEILPNEISDEIPIDFEAQNDIVAELFKCHNCDKDYPQFELEIHFLTCEGSGSSEANDVASVPENNPQGVIKDEEIGNRRNEALVEHLQNFLQHKMSWYLQHIHLWSKMYLVYPKSLFHAFLKPIQ